jgi:hypothetical protein
MKNNFKIGQVILIVLVVLIAIAAFIYFVTQSETAKKFRDGFKSKADELRRKIREKEDYIQWLESEIERLKMREGELMKSAKRIFMICKLVLFAFVILVTVIVHSLYSVQFMQALFGFLTLVGILFSAVTIILYNEVANCNSILRFLDKMFIDWSFKINRFEPKLIEVLEGQLVVEKATVVQLRSALEAENGDL